MSSKINNGRCFFRKFTPIVFSKLPPMVTGALTILLFAIKPHLASILPSLVLKRFFPDTVFLLHERHPWVVLPCYLFQQVAPAVPLSLVRVPTVRFDLPGRAVGVGFASFVALRGCIFPAHFFGKCAPWPLTRPSSVNINGVSHHAS